jgi:trypsin
MLSVNFEEQKENMKNVKFLIFFALFGVCLSSISVSKNSENDITDDKIVGGKKVRKNKFFIWNKTWISGKLIPLSDVPYQVSIQSQGRHFCGGAIIRPDMIVTAAHCLYTRNVNDVIIRVGTVYQGLGGELFRVSKFIVHPQYNYDTDFMDIALIKLSGSITLRSGLKETIRLADQGELIAEGTLTLVSGWGETRNERELNTVLRGVVLPTVSFEKCRKSYPTISREVFCAGYYETGGRDACQGRKTNWISVNILIVTSWTYFQPGDSGGPLKRLSDRKLIGVVSRGFDCAQPKYPGVYVSIAAVRSWIDKQA